MSRKVGSKRKLREVVEKPVELTERQKEVHEEMKTAMASIYAIWADIGKHGLECQLKNEEASGSAIKKAKSDAESTFTNAMEKSQDSTSEPTEEKESKSIGPSYERFQAIYGYLSKSYFEMLEIHAELGNDETSRVLEYIKR
jgi:hypothetical protein